MKAKRLLLFLLMATVLCSCKKDHYNTSNIHGVQMDGALQLPLITASYTVGDLFKSFKIDSIITFEEDGGLHFEYEYQQDDVLKGSDFMKFNSFTFDEHYSIENPYPFAIPQPIDTFVKLEYSADLESDYITVESGKIRSGILIFNVVTNVANIRWMIIRSNDIRQADGSPLEYYTNNASGPIEINLAGWNFDAADTHVLSFTHDLAITVNNTTVSEFTFDIHLGATEIEIQEMSGYVDRFELRNSMDTVFSMFDENIFGSLELKGAEVSLFERNSFGMSARLKVDTAWFTSEGLGNYSIFDPMPIEAELVVSPAEYVEVLNQKLNAKVNSNALGMYISSDVIFNPYGLDDLVYISDTSTIDLAVNVDVPLSFCADDVKYIDTLEMNVSGVDMPDMIEEIVLEMTFKSTLPLNLSCDFYMYNSETGMITDTLVGESKFIAASFDGQPTTTTVSINVTEDRVEHFLNSDHIVMAYDLDTDARDVTLNANQKLELFVQSKIKYNGIVETKND